MGWEKVGKYVLVRFPAASVVPSSNEERDSVRNFFGIIEYAARLSGGWDIVGCAKNDLSSPWTMLIAKTPNWDSYNQILTIVEAYYVNVSGASYIAFASYYNNNYANYQYKDSILNATDRSVLSSSPYNLIRGNNTYDLGYRPNSSVDSISFTAFPASSNKSGFVYIGPDIIIVGYYDKFSDQNLPSFVVNYVNFHRYYVCPSVLCRGFRNYIGTGTNYIYWIDESGTRRTQGAGIMTNSILFTSSSNLYGTAFQITPNIDTLKYFATKNPYLIYGKAIGTRYVLRLDWLLVSHKDFTPSEVKVSKNERYVYMGQAYFDLHTGTPSISTSNLAGIYFRVDEEYEI